MHTCAIEFHLWPPHNMWCEGVCVVCCMCVLCVLCVSCGFSVQAVGVGRHVVDALAERGVVAFLLRVQKRAAGVAEVVAHQLVLPILVALCDLVRFCFQ